MLILPPVIELAAVSMRSADRLLDARSTAALSVRRPSPYPQATLVASSLLRPIARSGKSAAPRGVG